MMTTTVKRLEDLKNLPQWVCYIPDKTPINPHTGYGAKSNDPTTWGSYDDARKLWASNKAKYAGVGFELSKELMLVLIDFDHCIVNGKLTDYAARWVARLGSYAEISPSKDGIHVLGFASIPKNVGANVELDGDTPTEIYNHKRYLTVTGNHLEGTPDTFENIQDALNELCNEVQTRRSQARQAQKKARNAGNGHLTLSTGDSAYGLKALMEECHEVSTHPEGSRNDTLNLAAFRLGQLVGGNELTQSTVERELYAAADRCGLSHAEIEKTMKSGLEAGIKEPRTRPTDASKNGISQNGTSPAASTPTKTASFNCTDLGNAERFAARYRDKVRWCETWNTWLVFNGKCWEADKSGRVDQMAKATIRAIYQEAANEIDQAERKMLAKHATASESNRAVRAMLDRAKSELPATPDEFNRHLYLLNCENGTLDLHTGELRKHNPHDMLTRCIKVKYNPEARSGLWQTFLEKFLVQKDLIAFLQQALGMSLCGDTSEQCLFICHGMGSNGKTTLLETVRILMASYACAANIETFQVRKNETIGNDIAELYGARLVTASETKLGGRLNEAFVKKATGKEPLRARRLHENEFEFMPEFTLWLAVNHKPVVLDTSKGMWRRVHFIPFNVTIEGDQVDKHFGDKLLEESEGILAWLVEGCRQWIHAGHLTVPQIVQDATAGYRAEMDIVANFLKDECNTGKDQKVTTKNLIARFEAWCGQNTEQFDAKILKNSLKERGYHSQRGTGGSFYWQGIGLKPATDFAGKDLWSSKSEGNSEGSEGSEGKNQVNRVLKNPPDATLNSPSLPSLPSLSEHENEENSEGTFTTSSDEEEILPTSSTPEEPTEKKLSPATRDALDQRYIQMQRESAETLWKRLDTALAGHQIVTWQGQRIPSGKFKRTIRGYIDQALYDQAIEPMREVLRYLEVGV